MPLGFRFPGTTTAPRLPSAANDNPPTPAASDFTSRIVVREALRHFASHGAGAAEQAHRHAEQAFFAGNRRDYRHWLAICRALDRRMVDALTAMRLPRS